MHFFENVELNSLPQTGLAKTFSLVMLYICCSETASRFLDTRNRRTFLAVGRLSKGRHSRTLHCKGERLYYRLANLPAASGLNVISLVLIGPTVRLREGKVGRSGLPLSNVRRLQVCIYTLGLMIASY